MTIDNDWNRRMESTSSAARRKNFYKQQKVGGNSTFITNYICPSTRVSTRKKNRIWFNRDSFSTADRSNRRTGIQELIWSFIGVWSATIGIYVMIQWIEGSLNVFDRPAIAQGLFAFSLLCFVGYPRRKYIKHPL